MELKDNSASSRNFPKNAFVEELIYENIDLMDENIKLEYELRELRKRVQKLVKINMFLKKYLIHMIIK
jgi:predicted nuclease with TOPRIM domain